MFENVWNMMKNGVEGVLSSLSVEQIVLLAWMLACIWAATYVHGTRRMRGVIFNHYNLDRLLKMVNAQITMRGKFAVLQEFWGNFCNEFGAPGDPYRHVTVHGYLTWEIINLDQVREQILAAMERLQQAFPLDDMVSSFFAAMGAGHVSAPPRMIPNPAYNTGIGTHPGTGRSVYDLRREIVNPAWEEFQDRLQMTRTWNAVKAQVGEVVRNIPPLFGWLEHRKGSGHYRPLLDSNGQLQVDAAGHPIMVLVLCRQIWWNNFIECFFIVNAFACFALLVLSVIAAPYVWSIPR